MIDPSPASAQLDRLSDHRDLALIHLEVDQLRRFLFFSRQLLFYLSPELFERHLSRFVHPGSTIEVLPVPPCQLRQLPPFGPANRLQFLLHPRRQMFVDGQQVLRLHSRFREPPLQEFVKRFQILQPPVVSRPHLAQVSAPPPITPPSTPEEIKSLRRSPWWTFTTASYPTDRADDHLHGKRSSEGDGEHRHTTATVTPGGGDTREGRQGRYGSVRSICRWRCEALNCRFLLPNRHGQRESSYDQTKIHTRRRRP